MSKKKKYVHIDVIHLVGDSFEDHDHIHLLDKVIETEDTPEEIAGAIYIDVYPCKKNGVDNWEQGSGVIFSYGEITGLKASKEMRDHYKELQEAAVGELHFEKCQIEELLNVLTAIEAMGDPLIAMVCKNAKEKHHINKLVHTRKLFPISYR